MSVTTNAEKVQLFLLSEHWPLLEKKLQEDWKRLNQSLRNSKVEFTDIQGQLKYMRSLFEYFQLAAREDMLEVEQQERQKIDNDF